MSENAFTLTGISKHFKNRIALKNVNLELKKGSVAGLYGPNGSGKTTLLKVLSTLLIPDSGAGSVFGFDLYRAAHLVRAHVGFVPAESRSFYWRLNSVENIRFYAAINRLRGKEINKQIDGYFEFFQIEELKFLPVSKLSSGAKQKLQLIRAFVKSPGLFLIDEISGALDADSVRKAFDKIHSHAKVSNATALVVSHDRKTLEERCEHIIDIQNGIVTV